MSSQLHDQPTKRIHYHGRKQAIQKIKYADPHLHSIYSDGILRPEEIVEQALEKKIATIVITDHDMIAPSYKALAYSQKNGYQGKLLTVLTGSEISAKGGHILGINIQHDISQGLSMQQTIYEIHKQGGVAIIPHPNLPFVAAHSLRRIIASFTATDALFRADGYEVFNAGTQSIHASKLAHFLYGRNTDEKARRYHLRHPIGAAIGSTDAHASHIGLGLTSYVGEFVDAVRNGTTAVFYDAALATIAGAEVRDMMFAVPKYYWGRLKSIVGKV